MHQITVSELVQRLRSEPAPLLLDVRENWEREIAHLTGDRHIPMGEITHRKHELDPQQEIVVYCHHGGRSAQVAHYLAQQGYERVINLVGGIDAWSREVDISLPRY
jgi:rhodanese-related sulfurtransferase